MHAVIFDRNKLVARRVARMFLATGASAEAIDEPTQVAAAMQNADVICADTFDADLVAEQLRGKPNMRGVLWTAEPLRRSLKYMIETTAIDHVLGRKDFESTPRPWEVLMVARRLAGRSSVSASASAPPLSAFLDWGFAAVELDVRTTSDRDLAVARLAELVNQLGVPKRIGEMFGELAHELLMNAMYDAPVDSQGRPRYAGDRKAEIVLETHERPTVRFGTDGTRLVLQVRDPFGRLERWHVVDGMARGLAGGEMDQTHGGAGLGMMVCHNASSAMMFDVAAGKHTEVTALFELDMNLREFRTQAKSLHFWSH
jgi:hypothetical protein